MRVRTLLLPLAAVLLVAALAGCAKKAEQAATSTSDSLLAQSPVEQPQGSVTPQQGYQPAPTGQTAPEPAREPERKRATHERTSTSEPSRSPAPAEKPGIEVPAGTAFKVTVATALTSETAQPGDAWTGTVKDPVVVGSAVPIPAGATVHGIVKGALPAARGDRAFLVLAARSIDIDGRTYDVSGNADSIIAGSTRARNVGAIAGGAAAGALLGKAIGGGSNKGALIGGLLGGAAATGAVAKSKGYQATVKEGTEITFTLSKNATIRR